MTTKTLTPIFFFSLLGAGLPGTPDGSDAPIQPVWNGEQGAAITPAGAFGDGWIYVNFPGFGTFSLGDSTTEGTFAYDLFQAFGGSFDGFEYVLMKTFSPSDINGGVIVFMPTIDAGTCIADFNSDGAVDLFDIFDFLDSFDDEDPATDIDLNGEIDVFDLLGFLGGYSVGC